MTEVIYFSVAGVALVFGLGMLGYYRSLNGYEGADVFALICLVILIAVMWPIGIPGYFAQRIGERFGNRSARIKQERREAQHRCLLEEREEQKRTKVELLNLESELGVLRNRSEL